MYNMPFFGVPYYRNYHRGTYNNFNKEANWNYNQDSISQSVSNNEKSSATNDFSSSTTGSNSASCSENACASNSRSARSDGQPFINILGIDLYSDDILILCILLSLYMEGVKDEMLFISLILLLLS